MDISNGNTAPSLYYNGPLTIVIITFYGNGLFVLLDDIIVDQCYFIVVEDHVT